MISPVGFQFNEEATLPFFDFATKNSELAMEIRATKNEPLPVRFLAYLRQAINTCAFWPLRPSSCASRWAFHSARDDGPLPGRRYVRTCV
jgi:hypothetical protein